MRQVHIDRFGGPDELHVVDGIDIPAPGPGDVVVRVIGAGTNPLDYKIRDGSSGLCRNIPPEAFPVVLGREACGEVVSRGDEVEDLAPGDWVFGMLPFDLLTPGCYSEYVRMPAHCVVQCPLGVDPFQLAGLSLVGLTAWVAANDQARVASEDTVLVQGGAGGVGALVVQLCVAAGATVYATASARNQDRIEQLGATFIDYEAQGWWTVVDQPDVIIDCVYHGTYEAELDHLKTGGRLVLLPSLADLEPARLRGINVQVPSIRTSRQRLSQLGTALANGLLSLEVSAVLRFDEGAEAHRMLETGHTRGKIILRP